MPAVVSAAILKVRGALTVSTFRRPLPLAVTAPLKLSAPALRIRLKGPLLLLPSVLVLAKFTLPLPLLMLVLPFKVTDPLKLILLLPLL